jgi:hypothetical protein
VREIRLCRDQGFDGYLPTMNVVIVFVFERDLMGSLLNDFMPVVLAVVIGQLSNYFRHYKAAAASNLMVLLVVVTL